MKTTALLLTLSAVAFAAPNFSGDWKMNIAKSDFGQFPAPEILTRNIKHDGVALAYTTHQKGASGDVTSEVKYTTDGKQCINKMNGAEAKGTAKWNGENLIIESTRAIQNIEIASKETWNLGEGGKTLTIHTHVSIPQQGDYDIKLVLERQ